MGTYTKNSTNFKVELIEIIKIFYKSFKLFINC